MLCLCCLLVSVVSSSWCYTIIFFFFKQKTAYEMRISDWSSDVCSSDLLERSIFMLDWLRDIDLRRRTQAGLNKGEARNALARALFFNQRGELRDRRFENQTYRASGLNLLVAAIILWNTRYLEMALADIGTPDEIARHIAPLGWEHISLTGDYSWNVEDRPDPDALRPLRAVSSLLAA